MKKSSLTCLGAGFGALLLAGCTPAAEGPTEPAVSADVSADVEDGIEISALEAAIAGAWRSDEAKARDAFRNPQATLEFLGVEADDTVVEIWPGGGWYSDVLAPYLASGGGTLIAAQWDTSQFEGERKERLESRIQSYMDRYAADADTFGTVELSAFSAASGPLAEAGTVDAVLTFRNVHNWMNGDYTAKFFEDAYAALKPGGIVGVVEHRLPSGAEQDPRGRSGYVHEDFVKGLAAAAGFEPATSSEINANPADTADHPFGVWTLPPSSRTSDRDGNTPDGFDAATYAAIGESDRMTLRFVKPAD